MAKYHDLEQEAVNYAVEQAVIAERKRIYSFLLVHKIGHTEKSCDPEIKISNLIFSLSPEELDNLQSGKPVDEVN